MSSSQLNHCWWLWFPCWGSVCQVSPCKVNLFGRKGLSRPHLRGGELYFTSLRAEYWCNFIWTSAWKSYRFSPMYIYSVIYLYAYEFMNIYFLLWVTVKYCLIWLLTNIHFCPSSPFSLLHNDLFKKVCIYFRFPPPWPGAGSPFPAGWGLPAVAASLFAERRPGTGLQQLKLGGSRG